MKARHAAIGTAVAATAIGVYLTQGSSDLTTFNGCGLNGNAKGGSVEAQENPLKNRFVVPASVDPSISFAALYGASVTANLDQSKAATIEGYVPEVKPGGIESCNCGSEVDLDTHIYVVPTAATDKHHSVIVEVTPRVRSLHPLWTQEWLKSNLEGHTVRFTGYILNDMEHKVSSFNDNPTGKANWRQTTWEIHPVTAIEIVR